MEEFLKLWRFTSSDSVLPNKTHKIHPKGSLIYKIPFHTLEIPRSQVVELLLIFIIREL
jgi:hypothetical protein